MIIVYFGEWPSWYPFFLESCKSNKEVKFLIFTDQHITSNDLENIVIINSSLSSFNGLSSSKLDLPIDINDAYKICDLRPAFGVIFSDYLKDFSFWGYTDIDVIFGNIRHFITDKVLASYDIITARKEYLVGHFTLYRNNGDINSLYKYDNRYKTIFLSKQYMGFDECGFLWWPLIAGIDIMDIPADQPNMTYLIKQLIYKNEIRALFYPWVLEQNRKDDKFNNVLLWENGDLTDNITNEQFLYFHFHYLKKAKDFVYAQWDFIPKAFYVSKTGFHKLLPNKKGP